MDIKQIQDLIKFVSKSGVNEVSIEEQDFKITIKQIKSLRTLQLLFLLLLQLRLLKLHKQRHQLL